MKIPIIDNVKDMTVIFIISNFFNVFFDFKNSFKKRDFGDKKFNFVNLCN